LGFIGYQWPGMFFVVNVALGVASLACLWLILKRLSSNWFVIAGGMLIYFLHGYTLWVTTVPMAENAALFLVSIAMVCLSTPRLRLRQLFALLIIAPLLVLTKYAYILIAVTLIIITFIRVIRQKNQKVLLGFGMGTLVVAGMGLAWLTSRGVNPFGLFLPTTFGKATASGFVFYSLSYIPTNFLKYLGTLAGFLSNRAPFLWLTFPLSSVGVLVLAVWGVILGAKSESNPTRWLAISTGAVMIATLPIFLIFYVSDARYLITFIPLLVIGCTFWLESMVQNILYNLESLREKVVGVVIVLVVLSLQLVSQLPLYKIIFVSNLLGRSVGWQYQAVQEFNRYFEANNERKPLLITALPPFLIGFYDNNGYRVLPLSAEQEFIKKGQYVWGDLVQSPRLIDTYQKLLASGTPLYISNAYITHQAQVISDFEQYKQVFKLELVQHGCDEACNIYRLQPKSRN
jgi:hypothetical protein